MNRPFIADLEIKDGGILHGDLSGYGRYNMFGRPKTDLQHIYQRKHFINSSLPATLDQSVWPRETPWRHPVLKRKAINFA